MGLFPEDYSMPESRVVTYIKAGRRRLFTNPDADDARAHFRQKNRKMVGKITTIKEAVEELVHDGDYLAVGGFSSSRKPVAVLHEIMRQKKCNLGYSGHTTTHDLQLLIAGKCINRVDVAYIVAMEARGLSVTVRKAFENAEVESTEWTNATLAWRFRAAAMGIPFIPCRSLLGTDTLEYSAAAVIPCPFTGQKLVAVPALFPDVAIIHVHRCDIYGNCQIDGLSMFDHDLSRAAKKLIITTEEIIPTEDIRRKPDDTIIPYYLVDAVIEAPFSAYPTNMPYLYFSDETHFSEWLSVEKDQKELESFMQKNIYNLQDHWSYIELNGGMKRISELKAKENLTNLLCEQGRLASCKDVII